MYVHLASALAAYSLRGGTLPLCVTCNLGKFASLATVSMDQRARCRLLTVRRDMVTSSIEIDERTSQCGLRKCAALQCGLQASASQF